MDDGVHKVHPGEIRLLALLSLLMVTACARPAPRPTTVQSSAREALLARLRGLSSSERFLFGQQNGTVWGMYRDGRVVSTADWFAAGQRTKSIWSDGASITGDHPAVLGVSLDMLAFEPVGWGRRRPLAQAIRWQVEQGGVATLDWHTPSCAASLDPAQPLATVDVDGQQVPVRGARGGMFFYAEEPFAQPIASVDDVPENVTCLCKIANDLPIASGAYQGLSARRWLRALARHTAQVMRAEGLAGLPLIVRPFHEHNGAWFWWGQPYWNCAGLLGRADAVTGPEAYKQVVRTFVSTLRSEPGMDQLLFAYSSDRLRPRGPREAMPSVARKVMDPWSVARDLLRDRLVADLERLGLAYVSPAQQALPRVVPADDDPQHLDQLRRAYREAYPGDDVIDLLGMDLYFPHGRPANETDLRTFAWQLRALSEEARARGKPHALTETGTYRLRLLDLVNRPDAEAALRLASRNQLSAAHDRLFAPEDRRRLLAHFGLESPADVALTGAELQALFASNRPYTEDWYNRQLLVLARQARVAYALVWQTFFDPAQTDSFVYHYVPFTGHPEAQSFRRFYEHPATCFLRDPC